jgi:hypothetical protein
MGPVRATMTGRLDPSSLTVFRRMESDLPLAAPISGDRAAHLTDLQVELVRPWTNSARLTWLLSAVVRRAA